MYITMVSKSSNNKNEKMKKSKSNGRMSSLRFSKMHTITILKEFEDTKGVIRINNRRTYNTMAKRKRTRGETTIYKTYTYN